MRSPLAYAIMDCMEIDVTIDGNFEGCPDEGWFRDIALKTLATENIGEEAEMSLFITGQERIKQLNKIYRKKDRATDVLSFPFLAEGGEGSSFSSPPDGLKHLGEVIISYPQAALQAQEQGHSLNEELSLLVVHGVLHLLGYDHIEGIEAEDMQNRQNEILDRLEEVPQ